MIIVEIYEAASGEWSKVGDVTFDGGVLSATDDGVRLINEPLQCLDDSGRYDIDPKADPEKFIRTLPKVITGSYYRAVMTRNDSPATLEVPVRIG